MMCEFQEQSQSEDYYWMNFRLMFCSRFLSKGIVNSKGILDYPL